MFTFITYFIDHLCLSSDKQLAKKNVISSNNNNYKCMDSF